VDLAPTGIHDAKAALSIHHFPGHADLLAVSILVRAVLPGTDASTVSIGPGFSSGMVSAPR